MDIALGFDGFLPYVGDYRRRRGDDRISASVRYSDEEGHPGPASGPRDVEALKMTFPASAEAPQLARRSLDTIEKSLDGNRLYELRLLVTELVTNSVRHAGLGPSDSIGFEVAVTSDRTRIEVSDRGHGFEDTPVRTARDGDDCADDPVLAACGSGWGFHLVEQLADRWGVSRRGGTRVWFEVDAPGGRNVADASAAAA
jgi:anti-sigma regulatory factor (Ser/Thr protein kinase)